MAQAVLKAYKLDLLLHTKGTNLTSMETKNTMIQAGEYCGMCGKTAKNEKEYQEMKNRAWYCSDECDKEGEKINS